MAVMPETEGGQVTPAGSTAIAERPLEDNLLDIPWVTIVWNDPVNLMSYVTWVLQNHFGYSRKKSEKLMMDVHTQGRAVVANGTREAMEADTEALHGYGLWATFQKDA